MAWDVKVWILLLGLGPAAFGAMKPLTLATLHQLQSEPCVFIHPWEDWCSICVQEMPELVPKLEKWKGVKVVVVDTGSPFAQAGFSKKWNVLKNSSLTTYLKPGNVTGIAYRKQIDPAWNGDLPYSVLYSRGKKKKAWEGAIDFDAVAREVKTLCR